MGKEFRDLSGEAQSAIIDAVLNIDLPPLPESVQQEIREWATPDAGKHIEECRACGYRGPLDDWYPARSVYHDVRCPQCESTNCQHNSDYTHMVLAEMRNTDGSLKPPKKS